VLTVSNHTLTHLYGIAGLLLGVVALFAALSPQEPWSTHLLIASGWIAAGVNALLVIHIFRRCDENTEKVGALTEQLASANKELANRSATLDYIAALQTLKPATRRATKSPNTKGVPREGS
jgi:hypothetical protein